MARPETPEPTTAAVLPMPLLPLMASAFALAFASFDRAAPISGPAAAAVAEGPTLGLFDLERRNDIF